MKKHQARIEEVEAKFASSMAVIQKQYQTSLTAEAVEAKKADAQMQYIHFVRDTCASLAVQKKEVLDQHFDAYYSKARRLCYAFLGMTVACPTQQWRDSGVKPLIYVQQVGKLLVGDGKKIWYHDELEVSIEHYFSVVQHGSHLYVIRRKYYMVCDLDLRILEKVSIETILPGVQWKFQGMTDDGVFLISQSGDRATIEIGGDSRYLLVSYSHRPFGGHMGLQYIREDDRAEWYEGHRTFGITKLVVTDASGPSICEVPRKFIGMAFIRTLKWKDKTYKLPEAKRDLVFFTGPMVGDVPTVIVMDGTTLTTIFLD
jgi:hypothetical protein